jgi:hypothetical protein
VTRKVFRRLLHRRDDSTRTLLVLALVALQYRNDAERLRRAHATVLALYNERGRQLDRLYRRVREPERETGAHVRAA